MKVYDYEVDGDRWCREGVATEENGAFFDTFWGAPGGSDRHRLSDTERESVRFRFDTDDFEEVGRYSKGAPSEWSERHPDDRATLPSQHGLTVQWFIRKGSKPDHATRLANAEADLRKAESDLHFAESRVKWAREEVQKIESEEGASDD